MNRIGLLVAVASTSVVVTAHAPAYAQQPRTFVSPTGSDSNNCTLAAPCRTFQGAMAQTNSGGEIAVLGSAGYNGGATFNISKPISIVNPGGFEAGIVVPSGGEGISFTTTGAVYLRGLTIEGNGVGQTGIVYGGTSGSLTIQDCVIRNVIVDGIDFDPIAASSLTVLDTYVANNGEGISVAPGTGPFAVTVLFNRVETDNNNLSGIILTGSGTGTINATAVDSVASGNGQGTGFGAIGTGTNFMVTRSVSANNGIGIAADVGAVLVIGQSTVAGNTNAYQADSGVLESFGTNQIDFNTNGQTQLPPVAGGVD
jgi:hypothetical protein